MPSSTAKRSGKAAKLLAGGTGKVASTAMGRRQGALPARVPADRVKVLFDRLSNTRVVTKKKKSPESFQRIPEQH